MTWRSTRLGQFPNHGERVVGFSTFQGDKCVDVVYFYKGITGEERAALALQGNKRAYIEKMEDVAGNNPVPWAWSAQYGPNNWFGDEIEYWCPLNEFPWPIEKEREEKENA